MQNALQVTESSSMQHDPQKQLLDILRAAQDISDFTSGVSFTDYHENKLLRAAVERKFEIIGEAMGRLAREAPSTAEQVYEFEKIIAFRNLVIHGYDIVSDPMVWDVVHNKLPRLIDDVGKLIDHS